ncbi:MAG: multiheme c-type cytochrome, partial [Chloroflexi bacterium]|nr:multiheme c-type cytochrome [Chloroflexota bacterium]
MTSHAKSCLGKFRLSWLTLIACLLGLITVSFCLIPLPVFSATPSSLPKAPAADPHRHKMLTRVQWVFDALQQTPDAGQATPINTTLQDFHLPGTQPNGLTTPLAESNQCKGCHVSHIVDNYAGSMMANAARDPLFRAALQVANKDAKVGGELCIRCHSPTAWLNGRATPSDGRAINAEDLQGVSCSTCHRLVPPTVTAGEAAGDAAERAALSSPFITGSAAYIVDRNDVRRGPFTVAAPHGAAQSSYLRSSEMCATCHDIDNPLLTFDNGTNEFKLNALNTSAPAGARLFPVERTYSEWKNSQFGTASGVTDPAIGALFPGIRRKDNTANGPLTVCQDCNMPMVASAIANGGVVRTVGKHQWAGGNSVWQDAITSVWGAVATDTHFDQTQTTNNKALGDDLLKRAAQVDIALVNGHAEVKVTNNTGHKLPTGYAEGRRMWLKVTQFNGATPIFTSGAWTGNQGPLVNDPNLKVYEIKQGLSDAHAQAVGLPAGESFHFILNNKIFKDNRIPPRGFTNAAFAARDAGPVAYSYPDAQYWDITNYPLAPGATQISVTLYYQTASDEYLDFLKNNAGGQVNDAVLGPTDWAQVVENARTQLGVGRPVPIYGKTLFFTRYVATTGDDASDCTDFTQPCKTINYAIGKADANNVIRVAAGTYTEAVVVNKAITLTGGFTLTNWNTPNWTVNQTIIDGQNNHRPVLIQDKAYFDGFIVRNGNAENANVSAHFGGGILINGVNTFDKASIVNTRLENNVAALTSNGNGGGLAAMLGNTFQILDQLILSNVTVVNNIAVKGDNGAGGLGAAGGGLFIAAQGTSHFDVDMTNVTVMNNMAGNDFSSDGGGIAMSLQGGTATLRQVKIIGNHAAKISTFLGGPSKGGGIDFSEGTLVAENVLIVRNDADEGGALHLSGNTYSNTVNLNFVTIADNSLAPGAAREAVRIEGTQNHLTLVNTLISGNAVAFAGVNTTQ